MDQGCKHACAVAFQRFSWAWVAFFGLLMVGCATVPKPVEVSNSETGWTVMAVPATPDRSNRALKEFAMQRAGGYWQLVALGTKGAERLAVDAGRGHIYLFGRAKPVRSKGSDKYRMNCIMSLFGDNDPACSSQFAKASWTFFGIVPRIVGAPFAALIGRAQVSKVIDTQALERAVSEAGLVPKIEAESKKLRQAEYDALCRSPQTMSEMQRCISRFVNYDPNRLIPGVKQQLAMAELQQERDKKAQKIQREQESRERETQAQADLVRRRELSRHQLFNASNIGRGVCLNDNVYYASSDSRIIHINPDGLARGFVEGQAQGFIEGFNGDGTRMQLRIKGWGSDKPIYSPVGNAKIRDITLIPGMLTWVDVVDWFLCDV